MSASRAITQLIHPGSAVIAKARESQRSSCTAKVAELCDQFEYTAVSYTHLTLPTTERV